MIKLQSINSEEKVKKPKKPMKNLIKVGLGLIVILILLLALKDTIAYSIFPKQYVISSINKSFKAVNKDLKKIQNIFLGDTTKKATTNNIKATIENVSSSDPWLGQIFKIFNGIGFEIKTARDFKEKSIYLGGKAIYGGNDFLSLDLKLDDSELLLKVPELYHKALSLPSKNLGKEWNKSAFAQASKMYVDESLDISFSELMKDADLIEMDKETKKDYLNAFTTFTKNAIYSKVGKEDLAKGLTSKKIRISIDSHDIKNGLIELIQAFENDNRLEQWKNKLKATNQIYAIHEIEQGLANLKNEIEGFYELDGLVFDVYIKNGKALQIDLEITPDFEYMDENLKLSLGFLGEKNISDDIRFELTLGQKLGKMIFTSKNHKTSKKNEIINEIQFVVFDHDDETIRLNSSATIDLSSKSDNLTYNLNILVPEQIKIDIITNGDFQTSSNNIQYNLHNVLFIMEDIYQDETINFSGSFFLSSINGTNKLPKIEEMEKVKVLELGQGDIYEITETIGMNIKKIIFSLGLH